jgi:predicted dehydrogenase
MNKNTNQLNRRTFLASSAAASSILFLPTISVAQSKGAKPKAAAPSEKLNMAFIGIGGRGKNDMDGFFDTELVNVVALCDIDIGSDWTSEMRQKYPHPRAYQDYRELFDKEGDNFDAVCIATPDHSHFPITMHALAHGKHVYVEKPLAHTFEEVELLMAMEKKTGLVTQMGNQGHSGANYFQFKAWEKAGVIKDVDRIVMYMNSPRRWHGWDIKGYEEQKAPVTIDWDLWNMARPVKPFNEKLHPGNWRSWFNYGNGAFGDWGPHILDTCHRFLKLGLPETIEAEKRDGPNDYIFPQASTIRFDFAKRGSMPPVKVWWYDGVENIPAAPAEMGPNPTIRKNGKYIYSKELTFLGGTHSDTLRIIPEDKYRELAPTLPKVSGKNSDHYMNFVLACKGQEEVRSPFSVSGPLTQVFLLGVIAQHLGGTLKFDAKKKRFENNQQANELLKGPPVRKGWEKYYKV